MVSIYGTRFLLDEFYATPTHGLRLKELPMPSRHGSLKLTQLSGLALVFGMGLHVKIAGQEILDLLPTQV